MAHLERILNLQACHIVALLHIFSRSLRSCHSTVYAIFSHHQWLGMTVYNGLCVTALH